MADPSHGRPLPPPPPSRFFRPRPSADVGPSDYELLGESPGLDGLDAAFEAFHLSPVPYRHRRRGQQQLHQRSRDLSGMPSSFLDPHLFTLSVLRSSDLADVGHVPFERTSSLSSHNRLIQAHHGAAGFERSEAGGCSPSFRAAAPSPWTNSFPVDDVGGSLAPLPQVLRNRQPRLLHDAGGLDGLVGSLTGFASPPYERGGHTLYPLDAITSQTARTRDGHGVPRPWSDVPGGDYARNRGGGGRPLPRSPDGYYRGGRTSGYGDARDHVHHHYADSRRTTRLGTSQTYSSMDGVRKDVLGAAKDHSGFKSFSGLLKGATAEEVSAIFLEVKDRAVDLMVDVYGSIPFQNLMDVCSDEQRVCILQLVTRDSSEFFRICCHTYGCRAVQKLAQLAETEDEFSLLASAMTPNVVRLAMDESGYHVLQHALRGFPDRYKQHLVYPIANNLMEIARDKSGCCVVQDCLDLVGYEQYFLDEIVENALVLSQDSFGNFVVQHALDVNSESEILKQLKGSHVMLSVQKFGSNVVEKCLRAATDASCMDILQELISSPKFEDVLKDRFGNYVIQTALQVSSARFSNVHYQLRDLISRHLPTLRNHIYGKWVIEMMHVHSLHDPKSMKAKGQHRPRRS